MSHRFVFSLHVLKPMAICRMPDLLSQRFSWTWNNWWQLFVHCCVFTVVFSLLWLHCCVLYLRRGSVFTKEARGNLLCVFTAVCCVLPQLCSVHCGVSCVFTVVFSRELVVCSQRRPRRLRCVFSLMRVVCFHCCEQCVFNSLLCFMCFVFAGR